MILLPGKNNPVTVNMLNVSATLIVYVKIAGQSNCMIHVYDICIVCQYSCTSPIPHGNIQVY